MLLPYTVDVPMERWPITNWLLIGATTVLSLGFLVQAVDPNVEYLILQRGEGFAAAQLVGNMFGHADLGHLIGNMLFLFCFGNAVNAKLGHFKFILAYLLLGTIAGLAWLALGDGRGALGASGAIMGVIGMYFVLYPKNNVSIFYCFWLLTLRIGSFSLSSYFVILIYIAFDMWGMFSEAQGLGGGGVAYISHLAGFAAGAALAALLVMARVIESTEYEENLLEVLGMR